jgi:hypothetical protein
MKRRFEEMKMKKMLMGIIAMVMAGMMLSACGGSNEDYEPVMDDTGYYDDDDAGYYDDDGYEDGDFGDDTEFYLQTMNDFIISVENLMTGLDQLMVLADHIASEEDLGQWCSLFVELKDTTLYTANELAEFTHLAPAEYQESHIKITIAVAAMHDAMTGFEYAVDAAINGDEDAFYEGTGEFIGNLQAAAELWSEAVHY